MKYIVPYGLLLLWMGVIFMLSSEGSDTSSGRSDAIVQVIQSVGASWPQDLLTFLTRKAAHIFAYFVLGVLAVNVLRLYSLGARRTVLMGVGFVLLYAASDELHQLFVPGRSGEVRDVLIDTVAGAVGVAAAYGMVRWVRRKK